MFRRIRSYCLFGIKAVPVSVEIDASQGLPGFTMVGLPDNAVRESRERVVSAIRSIDKVVTGFRTTVNLSPADLRKEGSALDLPLAIGLLVATGEIEVPQLENLVRTKAKFRWSKESAMSVRTPSRNASMHWKRVQRMLPGGPPAFVLRTN